MKEVRRILCVRRESLPAAWTSARAAVRLGWEGVLEGLRSACPEFVERRLAEEDASFKQLIPYLIVAGPSGTLACYPRQGAEARLHGLWSVGIGGHVDPPDAVSGGDGLDWRATLETAARRELAEELPGVEPPVTWPCLGVINEEETAVGTVHLGVVLMVDWDGNSAPGPTEELRGLEWVDAAGLMAGRATRGLEIWSDLALRLADNGGVGRAEGSEEA